MDLGNLLKELGAKSNLLWGVALGSAGLLLVDRYVSPLGVPGDWRWVLPVVATVTWSVLLTGLVASWAPGVKRSWERKKRRKRRREYAAKNLLTTGGFERAVLMHYKRRGQQRFRARRDANGFHEMVRHGLLEYDALDGNANNLHYVIPEAVSVARARNMAKLATLINEKREPEWPCDMRLAQNSSVEDNVSWPRTSTTP